MTRDEVREIARIVGGDKTYAHFFHRINKEFDMADEDRNNNVYTLYVEDSEGERVGFSVIGHSPSKMKVWEDVFTDEGWVGSDFKMSKSPFELMYMYVKPDFRKKGYGKKLFGDTLSLAKSKDIDEVYAYVGDRSPTALKFYKKMNAQIIQDFSDDSISAAFLRWQI